MGSRGGGFHIEYSAEELEELKFIAEMTPYQDMEALSVVDYLNHEHAGYMDIAFSINDKQGIDNQDSVVAAEASDKNADDKVTAAEADQSENVEDATAQKEEDTLVLAETSDKIVDEKTIIVEPTHQAQNSKDSSTERENEDVNVADESTVKQDEQVEATYDENHDDKLALMIVPFDQGQYIGQSSTEKVSIGESYQAQPISVISRAISCLPLRLRLRGWKIREHPRRDLRRKDKGSGASSQETGSSEATISDRSVDSEGWEELGKDKEGEEGEETYTEEEVQTSFAEAIKTLMNMRPDDDNDHEPPPPPPRQQMNSEAEAEVEAEAEAEASPSSKQNSTSTAPSTSAGGKRTRDECDPEEGPIGNKPWA